MRFQQSEIFFWTVKPGALYATSVSFDAGAGARGPAVAPDLRDRIEAYPSRSGKT